MIPALERAHVDQFRSILGERLGLTFDEGKVDELADVLRDRLRATGCDSLATYLARLVTPDTMQQELRALADPLTVKETYFFRTPDHFRALADVALPARARAQAQTRRLRLLSAGTATGEEAYTMAILVREHMRDLESWDVSVTGVDISGEALRKARRARYAAWSLRETPPHIQRRWFAKSGREFALDDAVRRMVSFEERNLLTEDRAFWQPGALDIVFCRNVIIYFSPEAIRAVIDRLARSLAPGGFLFVGHAETLRGVSNDFHLMHTHDTFYYQRRGEEAPASLAGCVAATWTPRWDPGPHALPLEEEEPAFLPAPPQARPGREPRPLPLLKPDASLPEAMELFRRERFDEAAGLLRALPPGSASDPDALLLLASVLTIRGEGREAEKICRQVLALDELNAGAHYLLALCRQQAGDDPATLLHARTAIYLDPTFAMPHLHLGRLARRAGDLQAARKELAQALHLLAREDSSRILLFGGGFHRSALTQMCQAELRACGGGR